MDITQISIPNLIDEVSVSDSIEDACSILKICLGQFGLKLMSVKFADSWNEHTAIRPLSGYPSCIGAVCVKLHGQGGCPFTKEAIRNQNPFELQDIDRTIYNSELDTQFFEALANEGLERILIVPVKIRRSFALYTMDLSDLAFDKPDVELLKRVFDQVTNEFVVRFPAIGALFEQTHFSRIEGQIISMQCLGFSWAKIVSETQLSELTIRHILKNAADKIGAQNTEQLIYKAIELNELTPFLGEDIVH